MLKRLALWLCRIAGIPATEPISAVRMRGGADAIERGARWEQFYREEGGIADMLASLRMEAFEAAAELDPKETDKIYYWATADRNLRRLQQRIEAVVMSGKIEAARIVQIDSANAMRRVHHEF